MAELDFFSLDRSIERVELKGLDVIGVHADLLAPIIEETDPIAESSDFRYFSRHKQNLSSQGHRETRASGKRILSSHVQPHGFQFRVVLDRVRSKFATEARTLIPTEGQRRIHQS